MPLSLQQPPAEDLGILRGVKGDSRPPQPPWGGRRAAGPDVFRGRGGGGTAEGRSRGGRSWELARGSMAPEKQQRRAEGRARWLRVRLRERCPQG